MATQQQIFTVLAEASGSMSRAQLEEKVGESYRKFQSQLDRWEKADPPLLQDVGDHHYILTEAGREMALQKKEFKEASGEEVPTDESLGTTEYQLFLKFGRTTGVTPLALIKQTADHIWNGGNYNDLVWVAKAMQEMGIRQDLRSRWFHSWRSHLKTGIPEGVPAEFFPPGGDSKKADEKEKEKGTGKRDYILSEDDVPIYVGEGNGDLDYKDALDLAKVRAARKGAATAGASKGPGSFADEVSKVFTAFREMGGAQVAGKSYVVKPAEGGYQIEELDPLKPVVVAAPALSAQARGFYVTPSGEVKELEAGKPIIINNPPPAQGQQGMSYMVDKATGQVTKMSGNEPIVIRVEQSAPASQSIPIQIRDKDGNPMVLDLSTYVRLEEHRDNQRRADESHKTKMEIATSFKDLLTKAGSAIGHVLEGKE